MDVVKWFIHIYYFRILQSIYSHNKNNTQMHYQPNLQHENLLYFGWFVIV